MPGKLRILKKILKERISLRDSLKFFKSESREGELAFLSYIQTALLGQWQTAK
jgi:hypothetical protein